MSVDVWQLDALLFTFFRLLSRSFSFIFAEQFARVSQYTNSKLVPHIAFSILDAKIGL